MSNERQIKMIYEWCLKNKRSIKIIDNTIVIGSYKKNLKFLFDIEEAKLIFSGYSTHKKWNQ